MLHIKGTEQNVIPQDSSGEQRRLNSARECQLELFAGGVISPLLWNLLMEVWFTKITEMRLQVMNYTDSFLIVTTGPRKPNWTL